MQQQIMGLINPAIALVFALLFLFAWRRDSSRKHILLFAGSYAALAAGFLIFHFVPDPAARGPILAMHLLYCFGCALLAHGVAMRVGQHIQPSYFIAIAVISSILMIASTYGVDQNPRLYIANSAYGLVFILAAHSVGLAARHEPIDRIIFWLLAASAVQFFVRPAATFILEQSMSAADYRGSIYYAVMLIVVALFSLLTALALLAGTVLDQMKFDRKTAETDLLTGLRSRRSFEQEALAMLARSKSRQTPVSLIVADLDFFKQVNDIWGHQVGDNAIRAFGNLIGSAIRVTDVAGRIGGEEYCIVVWDCSGPAAARLADRIRIALTEAEIDGMPDDIHLTASFGVAAFSGEGGYGRLFGRADAAMYTAKEAGRNCVHFDGDAELDDEIKRIRKPFKGAKSVQRAA